MVQGYTNCPTDEGLGCGPPWICIPPSYILREPGIELRNGDEIEIHIADARPFGVTRKPGGEDLLKRLPAFRGRLPADLNAR